MIKYGNNWLLAQETHIKKLEFETLLSLMTAVQYLHLAEIIESSIL